MAVGESGRIVLEIDPVLKKQIYAVLAEHVLTLKSWFIVVAKAQLIERHQLALDLGAPTKHPEEPKNEKA
jgi:hypothetical protein